MKRIIVAALAMFLMMGSILTAQAGKCTHGGENPTLYVGSSIVSNCISAGNHPVYVAGILSSCDMYFYRYKQHRYCSQCREYVDTIYVNGPLQHEYDHP